MFLTWREENRGGKKAESWRMEGSESECSDGEVTKIAVSRVDGSLLTLYVTDQEEKGTQLL